MKLIKRDPICFMVDVEWCGGLIHEAESLLFLDNKKAVNRSFFELSVCLFGYFLGSSI